MEAIIKRLLIVLAIVLGLIGSIVAANNYPLIEQFSTSAVRERDAAWDRYIDCEARKGTDCLEARQRAERDSDTLMTWRREALDTTRLGMCLVVAGILLWPLFYLGRWIFTGRLRRGNKTTLTAVNDLVSKRA